MGNGFHDAYRQNIQQAGQNVAVNAAGGGSTQSTAFGSQTHWIVVSFPGTFTATAGCRIEIGDNPTASTTSQLIPPNFPMTFAVGPGQKVAAISNDTATFNLSVREME